MTELDEQYFAFFPERRRSHIKALEEQLPVLREDARFCLKLWWRHRKAIKRVEAELVAHRAAMEQEQ